MTFIAVFWIFGTEENFKYVLTNYLVNIDTIHKLYMWLTKFVHGKI